MAYRDRLASLAMAGARAFGRKIGCQIVVEVSDHSISTSMEVPEQDHRAWDSDLYHRGQLYYKGYANPIKPTVSRNTELAEPDQVDVKEGEGDEENEEAPDQDGDHVNLISSTRYRQFMHQDLISQLLNPREQWKILVYAMIIVGGLVLINVMLSLRTAGVI